MGVGLIEVSIGIGLLLAFIYHYFTKYFDFWEKRNVPGPKPQLFFGNVKDLLLGKIHIADFFSNLYYAYPNEPVIGIFFGRIPNLVVKDLDIIREILIKNFSNFSDRGNAVHADIEPLADNLVTLVHKRWKPLRKKLSPVFTTAKLKNMFYLVNDCADHLNEYIHKKAAKGEPIETRDLTAKYTTDAIGVCAFGLNMNSVSDEDSEFRRMGKIIMKDSPHVRFRRLVRKFPHWIALLFAPIIRNHEVDNFFINTITNTMAYRKANNVRRDDFVDLLMDLKENPEKMGDEELTDVILTAQAFIFFVGGFETSSTTISHTMYEMALNPDIQEKLREEVKLTLDQNKGKLDYETIKEMKYLDKVFKETLRKYPPVPLLPRRSTSNHTFEGTKLSIPAGVMISIPVYTIHHDPKYYPNPEKFDPERFSEEIEQTRHPMSYLPFGNGPRNCIGERFAVYQTKIGIINTIKDFKFEVCEKTCNPYVKNINSPLLSPVGGLYLKFTKI